MTKNDLAYKVAAAKKVLAEAEAEYKALCAKYLESGGQTVVVEALGMRLNVMNMTKSNLDSEALTKHMIKLGKVKEIAASVTVVMSKLAEATDKSFAAKMIGKFSNEEEGAPFIKVTAA